MGRPKGSKNKKKIGEETNSIASVVGTLEHKENKTELEHNIVIHKKNAERRVRTGKAPKVTNLIKDYSTQDEPRGSPTGKCQECGKIFEQELSERRNAYQSYKMCPDCRKKRAVKQEEQFAKDMEDNVFEAGAPYQPYEWQIKSAQAFENHRFVVLACGNRTG